MEYRRRSEKNLIETTFVLVTILTSLGVSLMHLLLLVLFSFFMEIMSKVCRFAGIICFLTGTSIYVRWYVLFLLLCFNVNLPFIRSLYFSSLTSLCFYFFLQQSLENAQTHFEIHQTPFICILVNLCINCMEPSNVSSKSL